MIGMNAVVMDDAVIGANAFVAAMAFVKAGACVDPGTLVGGVPAKLIKELSAAEIDWKTKGTRVYQRLAQRYLETMREVDPLAEPEPDRRRVPDIMYHTKQETLEP